MASVAAAVAALAAAFALSGFYFVGAGERGVVTRLGRVVEDDAAPGLHYHAPWPLERAGSPRVLVVETAAAADGKDGARKRGGAAPDRRQYVTGDRNLIEAGIALSYEATDHVAILALADNAELLVRRIAESALAEVLAGVTMDDALGAGGAAVESLAAARVQAKLDALRSGVRVASVRIVDASAAGPAREPRERADAAARARPCAVGEAESYRARIVSLAGGEATALLDGARRRGARAVGEAGERAARFNALLPEYRTDPAGVRARLYEETMREVLRRVRTRSEGPEATSG